MHTYVDSPVLCILIWLKPVAATTTRAADGKLTVGGRGTGMVYWHISAHHVKLSLWKGRFETM